MYNQNKVAAPAIAVPKPRAVAMQQPPFTVSAEGAGGWSSCVDCGMGIYDADKLRNF